MTEEQDNMTVEDLVGPIEESSDLTTEKVADSVAEHPEDWAPVMRDPNELVHARPLDSQDDRLEGEPIESDEWLIREKDGHKHVVDNDVFESEFEYASTYYTSRIAICIPSDYDLSHTSMAILPKCQRIVLDVLIDATTQTIERMDVVSFEYVGGQQYESLPLEFIFDSPFVSEVTDDA